MMHFYALTEISFSLIGLGASLYFIRLTHYKNSSRAFFYGLLALAALNVVSFFHGISLIYLSGSEFQPFELRRTWSVFERASWQAISLVVIYIGLRTRKVLDANESFLSTLRDGTSDLIFSKNEKGVYLSVNREFELLHQQPASEIVGKTDRELFHLENALAYEQADRMTFEKGILQTSHVPVVRAGENRTFMVSKAPYRDANNRIIGLVGIGRDITELIRTRDLALQADKAKSQFLANMSHEIRTPLNGVVGMAELALATKLDSDQRYFIESITQSAESLMAVINDILDFSKIEAGKLTIEEISFDLGELVEGSVQLLKLAAEKKNISLIVNMDDTSKRAFIGDPGRIRQILINLMSNAIKFTHEGAVTVNINAAVAPLGTATSRIEDISGNPSDGTSNAPLDSVSARFGRLQFSVLDTGIGIPSESQGGIFDAFSQADGSTTRKFGGTGLGLSISKKLVGLMGGQIGVESILGAGSTFWFRVELPFGEVTAATPKIVEPSVMELGQRANLKILVAEDNPINQTIILRTLKKLGYRATGVANGREVLTSLENFRYDLILMDCHMPELDGISATQEIRRLPSSDRDITIVALTANAMTGEREKCLAAGMNDYLSKPVTMAQLDGMLRKWLVDSSQALKFPAS